MMNYEIFKEVVKEKFMDYMPEKFKGMELVAEPVEKVNVTLDGIILREEGRNISPTIYINDMYKKYQDCGDLEETLMAACDFMERAYEQAPVVDVDSIMRDANEKIVFQLINTEQNKTFLEQVPHREFQDLSIVYKVSVDKKRCVACGVCENTCPLAAVKVYHGCYAVVEETVCVGCGKCAKSCPAGCIEMKERTAM